MVKNNSGTGTIRLLMLSLLMIFTACAPKGPHKPTPEGAGQEKGSGTSYESVKGIFQKRCSRCHNGSPLPNWLDKATAEKKKADILRKISGNQMPPANEPEAADITPDERKKIIAWASGSGGAPAGNDETPVPDLAKLLREDKPKAREEFLKKCVGCHGKQGTSVNENYPNLASHHPLYIQGRLNGFLDPDSNSFMATQIRSILGSFGIEEPKSDNADVKDLFEYVSKHFAAADLEEKPTTFAAKRKAFDAATTELYKKGEATLNEKACAACHLADKGRPGEKIPMIFGQRAAYLTKRLPEEKASRIPDNPMPDMLKDLTEEDFKALVIYLSNTHPSEVKTN